MKIYVAHVKSTWFHLKKVRGQRNVLLIQSISSCYLINLCEYWGPRGQSRCVRTDWKVSSLFQELLSHSSVLKTDHLFYSEHRGSQEIGAWISKSFHLISIFGCSTSSLHTPSCPSNGNVYGHLAIRISCHQPFSRQLCSLRRLGANQVSRPGITINWLTGVIIWDLL